MKKRLRMDDLIKKLKSVLKEKKKVEIELERIGERKGEVGFVDGGNGVIFNGVDFCLSFVRVCGAIFEKGKKKEVMNEFFVLSQLENKRIISDIFMVKGKRLIKEEDLVLDYERLISKEESLGKVGEIARRISELVLAKKLSRECDLVVVDGDFKKRWENEEKFLELSEKVCALAKTSQIVTNVGENLMGKVNMMEKRGCYKIGEREYVIKLHKKSKYVFYFQGKREYLGFLLNNSKDGVFLGYPYGLVYVDKRARVSEKERKSLKWMLKARLGKDNEVVEKFESSLNAHGVLDRMEF